MSLSGLNQLAAVARAASDTGSSLWRQVYGSVHSVEGSVHPVQGTVYQVHGAVHRSVRRSTQCRE